MYQNGIKIVLDKIVALMALLLLSPIFILISLVLFLLQKQIFFIQTRVGKDQTRFSIYKFQTMSEERDSNGKLLPDAARINAFGKFLRATSLDELPQLFNILKGDMSIVGNRPLPLYEAELLTGDEYIERFIAPAGLTGLWQVEKRGEAGKLSAEERKQLDIKYAKTFSFWLDIKIILKTVTAFIQKENV